MKQRPAAVGVHFMSGSNETVTIRSVGCGRSASRNVTLQYTHFTFAKESEHQSERQHHFEKSCIYHRSDETSAGRSRHHDIDRDTYETRSAQIKKEGYLEILKSTWKVNGKERFWAVWEMK